MANWLVGLKLQNKQVAQIIIRLIHRIIVHDGDLTCNGLMRCVILQIVDEFHTPLNINQFLNFEYMLDRRGSFE